MSRKGDNYLLFVIFWLEWTISKYVIIYSFILHFYKTNTCTKHFIINSFVGTLKFSFVFKFHISGLKQSFEPRKKQKEKNVLVKNAILPKKKFEICQFSKFKLRYRYFTHNESFWHKHVIIHNDYLKTIVFKLYSELFQQPLYPKHYHHTSRSLSANKKVALNVYYFPFSPPIKKQVVTWEPASHQNILNSSQVRRQPRKTETPFTPL